MTQRQKEKGAFGDAGLPVSPSYVAPPRRGRLWLVGLLLAVAGGLGIGFDLWLGSGHFVSNGPLSSAHATLEKNCSSCHGGPGHEVTAQACSVCHEKLGDKLGRYTWAAHDVYRSGDFRRVVPSPAEQPCASCHPEHGGRQAALTRVPDQRCQPCHKFNSFADGHPEFAFARDHHKNPSGIKFAHVHHIKEVMKRRHITDVERACLTCHVPRPDGKLFQPLSFDRSCDACHLAAGVATPRLPIASGDTVGVETLATIRASGEPGTDWAWYADPNEYRESRGTVTKTPLHHEDPWILYNLRKLRQRLYGKAGLADLLTASPDAPPGQQRALYEEALNRLQSLATALRSRPETAVQEDLAKIEEQITAVRHKLADPLATLDETPFMLALGPPRSDLSSDQRQAIQDLVGQLTQACAKCHYVDHATIRRVQKDQRTLIRAEFDHRAHVVQTRCLDCHNVIPLEKGLASKKPLPPAEDNAAIYNLPRIASCRACHRPGLASQRCVTCHLFHPDSSRFASLLPMVDAAKPQLAIGKSEEKP